MLLKLARHCRWRKKAALSDASDVVQWFCVSRPSHPVFVSSRDGACAEWKRRFPDTMPYIKCGIWWDFDRMLILATKVVVANSSTIHRFAASSVIDGLRVWLRLLVLSSDNHELLLLLLPTLLLLLSLPRLLPSSCCPICCCCCFCSQCFIQTPWLYGGDISNLGGADIDSAIIHLIHNIVVCWVFGGGIMKFLGGGGIYIPPYSRLDDIHCSAASE